MDLIEVSGNENRHPWELSRTSCILKQLKKLGIHGTVLDIGCGDSYFDRQLSVENPGLDIYGIDIYLETEFHEGHVHAVNNLMHLPAMQFDFILMMDVLEHIEKDKDYLYMISRAYLKEDGIVFITVPAFMSLYSLHDKQLRHFRRYNHRELFSVVRECGLVEQKWTYFYFSLIFARIFTKNKTKTLGGWKWGPHTLITNAVVSVLNADFRILSALSAVCLHLPGLSLLSVCKKDFNRRDPPL